MSKENDKIILRAKDRFKQCQAWEAQARIWFDFDYKFANGDSHNLYQWDQSIYQDRVTSKKPVLTINKTQQHNLMIINDAKQNKPGVNIRPVGDEASFDAAQIYQQIVRHIEYISNAESVYDHATEFQVEAGIGYWRICTDYIDDKSFDQEIYIRRINDPRSVYLDPYINETDGSDARFGFIYEDLPKDLFETTYPEHKDLGWSTTFDSRADTWYNQNTVRIAEYYEKTQKKEKLVTWIDPSTGEQIKEFLNELDDLQKLVYKEIKKDKSNRESYQFNERDIVTDDIKWYKIAGNTIIDEGDWLGKYIPIVRLVGTETIIDGILDRKGHTRALIDAQKIYNFNTSANVEFGALQTKVPWLAPADAIEGHEEYWSTANIKNHSVLPWNHIDDEGNVIPAPQRPQPPQPSPAYVQQMQIAQNEMMMVTGQYQAQMGENENAKSGVAINARQRQGDRATYHFIDNNAMAVRFTGKILIDLIPKIYDTKRTMLIMATDGSMMNVTIDPEAKEAFQKVDPGAEGPDEFNSQEIMEIIFNPRIGYYDVQSEVGPSFATKRQEAFNALTQIAAQNKEFMGIAGDILWKVADFPEAQILAQRWRKVIPKNVTGDAPDPQTEQAMHAASDKIEQQLAIIAQQQKELDDKNKEFEIKAIEADIRKSEAIATQSRLDYEAETKRLVALGNSGPGIAVDQIQPIVQQLIVGMLNAGEPGAGDALAEKIAQAAPIVIPNQQSLEGQQEALQNQPESGLVQ